MNRVKRIILTMTLLSIVMGTVLALGTGNVVQATSSDMRAQVNQLQAALEQREAEHQAQMDAANQTIEQLQAAIKQRDEIQRAEMVSLNETITQNEEIIVQGMAEVEQAKGSVVWLQNAKAQREAEWGAQLEAANQTIQKLQSAASSGSDGGGGDGGGGGKSGKGGRDRDRDDDHDDDDHDDDD